MRSDEKVALPDAEPEVVEEGSGVLDDVALPDSLAVPLSDAEDDGLEDDVPAED